MASNALDLSLDALIEQNKEKRGRREGGGGRSGGGSRGPRGVNKSRSSPTRTARPAARRSTGHDDRYMTNYGVEPAPRGGVQLDAGNKILVQNLHYNVVEKDLIDLFSEVGPLRKASLLFDAAGRSSGTGEVVFQRGEHALAAIQQYNGVTLDGRAMRIDLVARAAPATRVPAIEFRDRQPPRRRRDERSGSDGRRESGGGRSRDRRRRGGRNRGERKEASEPKVEKTQDELDHEMDSYMNAKVTENGAAPAEQAAPASPGRHAASSPVRNDLDGDVAMS